MAKSDPNLLTRTEYAAHRRALGLPGGTKQAVQRAVDEKSISVFGPDKLIDAELADRQWAKNRRARISPQSAAAAGPDLADQASALPEAPAAQPAPPAADTGYTAARARREQAEAEQAEIQLAKLRGELVEREGVDRAGFEVGRDLRDALESSVNGLAAELAAAGNADRCAEVLRQHNRAVCDVLVKSWREKMGGTLKLEAPA
jgi:hypothetical protein